MAAPFVAPEPGEQFQVDIVIGDYLATMNYDELLGMLMAGERRKGVAHAAAPIMADHIPSVCCRDKGIVFRCFPGCHADIMYIGVAQLGLIFGLLEENEHLQRGAEFVRVTVALHKR